MSDHEAREKAYQICALRGHEPSGIAQSDSFHTWSICKHCGVHYREETVTKLIEKDNTIPWPESAVASGLREDIQ